MYTTDCKIQVICVFPEHSMEHWKDDDFYGFQFLNGVNPNVIRCCSQLPAHFPVTEQMVKPFLQEGSSLHMEMEVFSALTASLVLSTNVYVMHIKHSSKPTQ